ncbi:MAG: hypothetical protein P4M08_07700 [Oligoflexia bacterium]|nr:hypothetical protein [Oligoflexia bacterium]
MKRTKFLWITDPWHTLDHEHDTTLRLAQEALAMGHESWWCDVKSIRLQSGRALLEASQILSIGNDRSASSISLGKPRTCSPSRFHSLQYRVDPPVDLAYLQPLQILRVGGVDTVNPMASLFLANEKLEGMLIPRRSPPSLVAAQWEPLSQFGRREKKTVMKPLHLAQSRGIELLDWTSSRNIEKARKLITAATENFQRPVLLQRFLPAIAHGETRLWLLDGKLLATARKLPLQHDFRVNIDRGSKLVAHAPSAAEKRTAAAIGARLRALGVRMAAVDLIDGYITDFNITSPGLITQMEQVTGRNLARAIIAALSRRSSISE